MTIFGDQRRPWVVALDVDETSELASALRQLAPVVRFLPSDGKLQSTIRLEDFDAVVAVGEVPSIAPHLYVLQFGGTPPPDRFKVSNGPQYTTYVVHSREIGVAGQLEAPEQQYDEVTRLSRRSLAPYLLGISPREVLRLIKVVKHGAEALPPPDIIEPFVTERNGAPCAGRWARGKDAPGLPECWWLPSGCPDQGEWVVVALAAWSQSNPDRFPPTEDWTFDHRWMTKEEVDARHDLESAEARLARVIAAQQAEVAGARTVLDQKRAAANMGERRLLTDQGDELKAEVLVMLEEIGFSVIDSDKERVAESSMLLEDLEVSDNDSGWVAVAEVRGYNRGAKTSDLQRLARAARGFERRNGREPDARWYVVNHNLTQNPMQRRKVLAGAESDVDEFAVDGGCVMDTRDLFLLREAVRRGDIRRDAARTLLKTCRGTFVYSASDEDQG